jgi:ABC-type Fe3+ transport system permease subunit
VIGTPAGFSTITTRIYADLTYSSDPQSYVDATTLAVLLVILTLVVVGRQTFCSAYGCNCAAPRRPTPTGRVASGSVGR